MLIYKKIARQIPDLGLKLRQARMVETPEEYVQKNVTVAAMLAIAITFILFLFTKSFVGLFFLPVIFVIAFFYFARRVDLAVLKMRKQISQEIVYAGRFLLIEIESGVPMYNGFRNLGQNFEHVGRYFNEIVEKVDLGTTLEDAMNETIVVVPDPNLRKLLWQVLNALKTGSDLSRSLNTVLDQIVREQNILVQEYGRKLNPLAMFYMMAAIIIPSLGTTMLVVMSTFVNIPLDLWVLLVITFLVAFVQFMFLSIIRSSRPPMEI